MAGARIGATFAHRFQTTTLARVDDERFFAALQSFVSVGWEVAGGATGSGHVEIGWRDAIDGVEGHVGRILERLPERKRQFVEAIAELSPEDRKLTAIAQ